MKRNAKRSQKIIWTISLLIVIALLFLAAFLADAALVRKDYTLQEQTRIINVLNPDELTTGYVTTHGTFGAATTLAYTKRIPVVGGDTLALWHIGADATNTGFRFVTAYDENGSVIPSAGADSSKSYTVPAGVASVVFTISNDSVEQSMILKNASNSPYRYIAFNDTTETLEIPRNEEDENSPGSAEYGPEYITAFGNMSAGTTLTAGSADIITDKHLTFIAEVTSFEGLRLGHGYQDYTASYIEIDNTMIKQYFYNSSPVIYKEVAHGLEIKNDIKVTIDVNNRLVATITLSSDGQVFTFSSAPTWYGNHGDIYATSLGSELTNAELLFTCDRYADDIQFYGDSYLSQVSDRWLYFAFKDGYTGALFDGYGGRSAGDAYNSLVENLKHSNPEIVVWMMGMNNGSDPDPDTPSNSWATYRDKLIELSETEGFEIVFATIPTVPGIYHEAKNKWIRESGYRYIDVAAAVGADSSGTWTQGMLNTDNIHPSASGSAAIYQQVKDDLPEFTPDAIS